MKKEASLPHPILRSCWFDIVLNVRATTKNEIDIKESFYEEVEHVYDQFQYHMKILLRDFNTKLSEEDIFKPTIGNESLHEIGNDDAVIVVNSQKSDCEKCSVPTS
jgi:hypothetical protein